MWLVVESDDATFNLNGIVDHNSCSYRADENPGIIKEHHMIICSETVSHFMGNLASSF